MSRRSKRVIRPKSIRLHVPSDSGARDYRQVAICTCGSAWDASVHRVPELTEEQREIDARKVGERESTQDTETR